MEQQEEYIGYGVTLTVDYEKFGSLSFKTVKLPDDTLSPSLNGWYFGQMPNFGGTRNDSWTLDAAKVEAVLEDARKADEFNDNVFESYKKLYDAFLTCYKRFNPNCQTKTTRGNWKQTPEFKGLLEAAPRPFKKNVQFVKDRVESHKRELEYKASEEKKKERERELASNENRIERVQHCMTLLLQSGYVLTERGWEKDGNVVEKANVLADKVYEKVRWLK